MRLVRTSIDKDRLRGFQRHEAVFRSSTGREFTFFLIFSEEFISWLSEGQDHWFVLGVTSAALLGESYSQDAPVSALLKRHMLSLVRQWGAWFPGR